MVDCFSCLNKNLNVALQVVDLVPFKPTCTHD